jgi:hypothetical protein
VRLLALLHGFVVAVEVGSTVVLDQEAVLHPR